MQLREIMRPDPICLSPGQSIKEAAALFAQNEIDGAPVVDNDHQLIGLFTKSHIYRAINEGIDLSLPIEGLMQRNVITSHPEDEVYDVLHPGIGRLPIVDETGVVGIITRTDLAGFFFRIIS